MKGLHTLAQWNAEVIFTELCDNSPQYSYRGLSDAAMHVVISFVPIRTMGKNFLYKFTTTRDGPVKSTETRQG